MRFYLPMNKKCWFSGMKRTCRPSGRRAEVGLRCGFPPARAKTMRISANSAPPPAPARPGISHYPPKVGQKEDLFLSIFSSFLISGRYFPPFDSQYSGTEREWADSGGWLAHAAIRFPIPFPRRPEANFMTCRGGRRREAHRDLLLFPFPPGP